MQKVYAVFIDRSAVSGYFGSAVSAVCPCGRRKAYGPRRLLPSGELSGV